METEPQIVQEYIATGKVRLIYRHLLQLGQGSVRTAEASECAADQGKFWPMHDALYARQGEVYQSSDLDITLGGFAQNLGLNRATFDECMQANTHLQFVEDDYNAARAEGVQSRPVFDIGGDRLIGALPYTTFQSRLDDALSR